MALSLNRDKLYWAGLAVAVINLGRMGDSLNKGLLRAGATVAVVIEGGSIFLAVQKYP